MPQCATRKSLWREFGNRHAAWTAIQGIKRSMLDRAKYLTLVPDVEFWKEMVPCQAACPIHTDSGKYVQLIAEGKYEESYLTARSPNPFASVCGRVCAAPCEDRCRRGVIDAPVSIRAAEAIRH